MDRIPVNPGMVDWSGENPVMYLKESADGPFVTLISFFPGRVVPSREGARCLPLPGSHGDGKTPGRPNICVTDNEPLARYLKDNFVAFFAAFKGVVALSNCVIEEGSDFIASGDTRTTYTERFSSSGGEVSLTWAPLGDAFMIEMPKGKSATGQHEMFSLFVSASGVRVSICGTGVAGRPFPREVAGKASSTAFLAFSETWVRR